MKKRCKSLENFQDLVKDLGLDIVFKAMVDGDRTLEKAVRDFVLSPCRDLDVLKYRQEVLKDAISKRSVVRHLRSEIHSYLLERRRLYIGLVGSSPSSSLYDSKRILSFFITRIPRIVDILHSGNFKSEGFLKFEEWLVSLIADSRYKKIHRLLEELDFKHGYRFRAKIGEGLKIENVKAVGFVKRKLKSFFTKIPSFSFDPRDEGSQRVIHDLKEIGLSGVAKILKSVSMNILRIFEDIDEELSFCVGALNLHSKLLDLGMNVSFPEFSDSIHFKSLADVSLTLIKNGKIVPNSSKLANPTIITGVNKGGKTTFLRSVGSSQIMAQSGMFVTAVSYKTKPFSRIFTHFRRESKEGGSLEGELLRLKEIVRFLDSNSMILMNETFSTTDHRTASEMAKIVIDALVDGGVWVIFVTHLLDFVKTFERSLVLTPERLPDGERTFKIIPTNSVLNSYAEDVYNSIFEV